MVRGSSSDTGHAGLSQQFAAGLAAGDFALPMLPGVATEVLQLCQNEATDAARLSNVIHRDQTLASNVLRVANSALLAGQVPIASLQQAVSRLGMQRVVEIALAVSTRGALYAGGPARDLLQQLWRHSVMVGFFAKEVARVRRRNVEIAFLCGLLHDVGKAVLLGRVTAASGSLAMGELADALHEHHEAAGHLLAVTWKLPDQIVEAISCHHHAERATRFSEMTLTVQLADLLAHAVLPSAELLTGAEALRQHPVLTALNLYPDELDRLLALGPKALQLAEVLQ